MTFLRYINIVFPNVRLYNIHHFCSLQSSNCTEQTCSYVHAAEYYGDSIFCHFLVCFFSLQVSLDLCMIFFSYLWIFSTVWSKGFYVLIDFQLITLSLLSFMMCVCVFKTVFLFFENFLTISSVFPSFSTKHWAFFSFAPRSPVSIGQGVLGVGPALACGQPTRESDP